MLSSHGNCKKIKIFLLWAKRAETGRPNELETTYRWEMLIKRKPAVSKQSAFLVKDLPDMQSMSPAHHLAAFGKAKAKHKCYSLNSELAYTDSKSVNNQTRIILETTHNSRRYGACFFFWNRGRSSGWPKFRHSQNQQSCGKPSGQKPEARVTCKELWSVRRQPHTY